MAFEIRKAERKKAKLRLGLGGPAGSGKTASALLLAYGIVKDWSSIGFIDTENGSGELYVNATIGGTHIGEYLYGRIEAPFTPQKYVDAIRSFENAGVKLVIIDSLSHAWAGEGGLLEQQGREADRSGNSYTAWRKVTPQHNQLVEALLQSKCHIVTTIRAKTEYSQEKGENGKTTVKKLGMGLIQRDGMDFEFTVMLDLGSDHYATVGKDRTNLLDGRTFKPSVNDGEELLAWLETGADAPAPTEAKPETAQPSPSASPSSLNDSGNATPPAVDHPNKNKITTALCGAIHTAATRMSMSGTDLHALAGKALGKDTVATLYELGPSRDPYAKLLNDINVMWTEQQKKASGN